MKILFADDSATMRKVAEISFASDGYDLVTVGGGASIVDKVKEHQPTVVVLDADMPDASGYDACKKLRGEAGIGSVPVMLLHGPSSPYDERRAKDAGITEHMDKPFETQALYDKLNALATAAPAGINVPAPTARPAPAAKKPPKPRPKVGQKTVLGLGAMGGAPPQPAAQRSSAPRHPAAQRSSAPRHPAAQRSPAPPPVAMKPKTAPTRKQAPPAKPGPLASPVSARPKPAIPKLAAKPTPRPAARPAAKPIPKDTASGLASLSSLSDQSKSVEQKVADLSPEQVDAIKAVAQEVIERVVWEVVPELAETIIKEQLAKLLDE